MLILFSTFPVGVKTRASGSPEYKPGCVPLALALLASTTFTGSAECRNQRHKAPLDLPAVLSRMDQVSRRLRTLSADLEYTKVTVVVNDKSTQQGRLFYAKGKLPELLIDFKSPDPKTVLIKKNRAEIYLPKINQIQEFDLEKHRELVQQFLLLGFGTESSELEKSYKVKLAGEQDIDGDTAAVLELTSRNEQVGAQLAKVELWIDEESGLPVQQKFFEPGGDYLVTRYTDVRLNRRLPPSTFEIHAGKGVKRVEIH